MKERKNNNMKKENIISTRTNDLGTTTTIEKLDDWGKRMVVEEFESHDGESFTHTVIETN